VNPEFESLLEAGTAVIGINIEKLDRSVVSDRGRAHPGPVRKEKEGSTGPDRDLGEAAEGLDLALRRSGLLDLGHDYIGA